MTAVFSMPTKIISGIGCISDLSNQISQIQSNSKVFICTDEGIVKTYIIKKVLANLEDNNIGCTVFSDVVPNPKMETVNRGLIHMQKFSGNIIVAVGGGSSIDTAKAIGALAANGGEISDYEGRDKLTKPVVPIIAIPTTYGTGSEAGGATMITNEEKQYKMLIASPYLRPKIAFIDPELMVALPTKIAASTAVDALTHAIESYTSILAQPITDALNIKAIKLIAENAPQAVMSNINLEATGNVAIASTIAGMAFTNTGLGLVHAIAHAIGGIADVPHGVTNAILLPHVMKYNMPAVPVKYKEIGIAMGEELYHTPVLEAAAISCSTVAKFSKLLEIPERLRDIGVKDDKFEQIAEYAMIDGNYFRTPRSANKKDILSILKQAY